MFDINKTVAAYEDTDTLVTYSHDIGEVASGAIQSTSLSAQEKASFFEKSFCSRQRLQIFHTNLAKRKWKKSRRCSRFKILGLSSTNG